MKRIELTCGFIPLVDCAPLVVALELGFAEDEGLALILRRLPSWSAIRDQLAFGQVDAAHMLSPLPVAMSMGLGAAPMRIDALSVLSVNGDVIGVSSKLAARMREIGAADTWDDPAATGRALIAAADGRLSVGSPFPFSMHSELLYYWLNALGLESPAGLDMRTIPPPMMVDAVAAGEVDVFCVGEPWGGVAARSGVAELIAPGSAIWSFAPEKVLAVRHEDAESEASARLLRAVWRAGKWLSATENRMIGSEILARPEYLDLDSNLIERAMTGRLMVDADGTERTAPRFIEFFDGAATFPWRSQAIWIAERWAARAGVDKAMAVAAARACYRADIYRRVLGPIGADMPGASEKIEGGLSIRTPVASSTGQMYLGPDQFFDGLKFDPATADA
ncbi:MAG: CmpA/NrtA family ABC transporter substrate-binding protein [Pseudomonadota bacterium]